MLCFCEIRRREPPTRDPKEECALSRIAYAVDSTTEATGESRNFHPKAESGLLKTIIESLDQDKAEDVVTIDLRGKTEIADFMVICSGRSSRQVISISEKLVERLKHGHGCAAKVEGKDHGDWVLIDAGDAIIHVFKPEVREFYQLEKLWMSPSRGSAPKE